MPMFELEFMSTEHVPSVVCAGGISLCSNNYPLFIQIQENLTTV